MDRSQKPVERSNLVAVEHYVAHHGPLQGDEVIWSSASVSHWGDVGVAFVVYH